MPIRLLQLSDKQQILALDKIIFGSMDEGWSGEDFDHFFNTDMCFVFHEKEKPNAINGYIFARQSSQGTYVSNIGVIKEGQGIGKERMKSVMLKEFERSKNNSFSTKLRVYHDNQRALKFYQLLGFKEFSQDDQGIEMEAKVLPKIFLNEITKNELNHHASVSVKEDLGHKTPVRELNRFFQAEYNESNSSTELTEHKKQPSSHK